MNIVECNVPVKSADAFFGGLCAPDALQRYYNPFGEWVFPNKDLSWTAVSDYCAGYLTVTDAMDCKYLRPSFKPFCVLLHSINSMCDLKFVNLSPSIAEFS